MTEVQLEGLLDWFIRKNLLPAEPRAYYRDIYRTACRGLTTEELKAGCCAVQKKHFPKAPHPLTFKALCLGEWQPATHEQAKKHIQAMRKAINP